MHILRCLSLVALALLIAAPAASAATVKGSFKKGRAADYTLLGLGCDGSVTVGKAKGARGFTLKLPSPARGSSLQLLDRTGSYLGPVVLRRDGKKGALSLRSATKGTHAIGRLAVKSGFALRGGGMSHGIELGAANVRISKRTGKPIGAGKLGLRRSGAKGGSCAGRASAAQASVPEGSDSDLDGIPNGFDVDDNGNTALDTVDPNAGPAPDGPRFYWFSDMFVDAADTLNARVMADPAYDQGVKDFLRDNLGMPLGWTGSGDGASSVVVDCGNVRFCARQGSTATLRFPRSLSGQNWVEATRTEASGGNPTIPYGAPAEGGRGWSVTVVPRLSDTVAELEPGRTLLATAIGGGDTTPVPVPAFFLTQPALTAIGSETIDYPVTDGGREMRPMTVSSTALRFTWHRPQRPPVTDAEKAAFDGSLANLDDYPGLRYYPLVWVEDSEYVCGADAMAAGDTRLAEDARGDGTAVLTEVNAFSALTLGAPNREPLTADYDFGKCTGRTGTPAAGKTVAQALEALPAGQRRFKVDFFAADLAGDNGGQFWFFRVQ